MTIKPCAANREIVRRDIRSTQETGRQPPLENAPPKPLARGRENVVGRTVAEAIEQKGNKLTRPC